MTGAASLIFDRPTYRLRRRRASTAAGEPFLAEEAARAMAERLSAVNRKFGLALDLGSREAGFHLLEPFADSWVRAGFAGDLPSVIADEEALPFAEGVFDLVVSVLSLHAVNDLPGALVQIRRALKSDGLFLAALFSGETLAELRLAFAAAESETLSGASPRVAPFADLRDLGGLLQRARFALPVADVERFVIRYLDLSRLFSDMRKLGETNVLSGRSLPLLSRRVLSRLTQEYQERFGDADGRVTATFEVAFLTGWAPHESQQQPLKPGSARARLADALKTTEQSAGERASPREKR